MNIKKIIVGVAATGILMVSALPAFAATPNNQGCVGQDFSGAARIGNSFGLLTFDAGSGWGHIHNILATNDTPGFGAEIQNHQAGLVPDTVVPNTCNN